MGKVKPHSHERIRRRILDGIEGGRYPPGSRIPSIREIARDACVSTLTVARAVRELAENGYLRTEHGRGCFVQSAHPNASSRRGTVVMLLSVTPEQALHQSYFARTLATAQQVLMNADFDVFLHRYDASADHSATAPPGISAHAMVALGIFDYAVLYELARSTERVVVMDLDASSLGLDSVFLDDFTTTGLLVRALAQRGARRIAYVGGPLPSRESAARALYDPAGLIRLNAWRAAVAGLGLPCEETLASYLRGPTRDAKATAAAVRACLRCDPPPDAILAENAWTAFEASRDTPATVTPPLVAGWAGENGTDLPEARMVALAVPDFGTMGHAGAQLVVDSREPTDQVERIAIACPIVQ